MTWSIGFSEDLFGGAYETREEALAIAKQDGQPFIAENEPSPRASRFFPDAQSVIENMQESTYDDYGESADDWLSDVTRDQRAELHEALAKAVDEWADKHGLQPTFFTVKNVEAVRD